MSHARRLPAVAVVGVLGALSWGVGSAGAADGQWYIDDYQIRGFHDQGVTGAGVTVAVIDSKINLDAPALQGVDIWVQEPSACVVDGVAQSALSDDPALAFHGTSTVSALAGSGQSFTGGAGVLGIAPDVKVLYYYDGPNTDSGQPECEVSSDDLLDAGVLHPGGWVMAQAIIDATDRGADIISISQGQGDLMEQALAYAYQHDVIVVAAHANDDSADTTDDGWLVAANGVIGVGAIGDGGAPQLDYAGNPNTSPYTDVVAPGVDVLIPGGPDAWGERLGSGTSFATPVTAGNLALAIQKYPNATHNQIIQSLIHNTGAEAHELSYDSKGIYGYGIVDTISLLAADPTQYEDVNPLFDMSPDAFPGPKAADVFGTDPSLDPSPSPTADAPDPSPSPDTPNPNTDDTTGKVIIILAAAGALLLLLVAIGITATIIHRKRNQGSPGGKP